MLASFASKNLRSALLAILPCAIAAPALAASPVTYVSASGSDSGGCATAASACRTFAYAIGQTSAGGDMKAIDAGDFGPFTINKAISVTGAPGASAGQSGPFDVITVAAAVTDSVNISGLVIQGLNNTGYIGVKVNSAGLVTIKNCHLRNLKGNGVFIQASGAVGGKVRYLIEDTTIAKVAGHGISLSAINNVADGVINRVSISGAGSAGIASEKFSYGDVTDTTVVNSGVGFKAGSDGWIQLARSTATANNTGLLIDPNAYGVFSFGNNLIYHNGSNISGGVPTVLQLK
ncbi:MULTISPECIES: right-handed parallel beta-helix repeat-containing protein [Methylosinus]|nr:MULTISPECIES: right-handed parallel beta-helix repeat-containing protein [Methylosinus]OBS53063.1 hypothetical protein A8B73_07050 [Methylosinus sp. 3S-1]